MSFSFISWAEVEIGSISAIIYEHFDELNLIYDSDGKELSHTPINKGLVSLTPQFIWKEKRNMLLLNLEIFGSMGSQEGSFAKDGKLEGQLKADSFYIGYFRETPLYIKFGKYPGDLPFYFGCKVTTGQVETGYNTNDIKLFYASIFYNWFNKKESDDSYSYVSDKYVEENSIIQLVGLNLAISSDLLRLRLPIESTFSNPVNALYPSISYKLNLSNVSFDNFIGMAYREGTITFGIREEITINYGNLSSKILAAHLTAGEDTASSYNYTSTDNTPLEFHYGEHFNYLYEYAGNIYGLNSIALYQSWSSNNTTFWASLSGHLTAKKYNSENREDMYIGAIISGGLKINDFWSENTLFETYISYFNPGGFSIIDGKQSRDSGLQIVIKLQHIMF